MREKQFEQCKNYYRELCRLGKCTNYQIGEIKYDIPELGNLKAGEIILFKLNKDNTCTIERPLTRDQWRWHENIENNQKIADVPAIYIKLVYR